MTTPSSVGSVASAELGGNTYVFFYSLLSSKKLAYTAASVKTDDTPYKPEGGTPITYTSMSCNDDEVITSGNTVSVNEIGKNPLAAVTWHLDGKIHLFHTVMTDQKLRLSELIYDGSTWVEGELKCSELRVSNNSSFAALSGSSSEGDYPKLYYVAGENDVEVMEAYWKNNQWYSNRIGIP